MISLKDASIAFAAGALGAFIIMVLFWLETINGITAFFKIDVAVKTWQELLPDLYRIITWGGLWGLLLLLPIMKNRYLARGVLFGSIATLVEYFYFAPQAGLGYFAIEQGYMMPVNIFLLNLLWGIIAASWYQAFHGSAR